MVVIFWYHAHPWEEQELRHEEYLLKVPRCFCRTLGLYKNEIPKLVLEVVTLGRLTTDSGRPSLAVKS